MIKLAVLGSCVTRDAFAMVTDHPFNIGFYGAKSNIPSMVANPVTTRELLLPEGLDGWRKRQLFRDFEKTTFEDLASEDFDFLLLDLIEERFDLVSYRGSYITSSDIYAEVETDAIRSFAKVQPRATLDPDYYDECFDLFSTRLMDVVDTSRIILNRVLYAEHAVNSDGEIVSIASNDTTAINKILDHGCANLRRSIPGLRFNDMAAVSRVADPNHRWGFHPFHYTRSFYEDMVSNTTALIRG